MSPLVINRYLFSVLMYRLVLSSVSDYFAAMFTSDVREAKQEEVKMEGVDPDALWVLVQYAYTGKLQNFTVKVLTWYGTEPYKRMALALYGSGVAHSNCNAC